MLDRAVRRPLTVVRAPAGYGKTVVLAQWATSQADDHVAWLTLRPEHNDLDHLTSDLRLLFGSRPGVVVLDDFDALTAPDALDQVAEIVEHLPLGQSVALATRADVPLRYYRLRLTDALVELGPDDLAFTREEADQFLELAVGTAVSSNDLDVLVGRTVGWPKALDLAAQALRDGTPAEEFSGDDPRVAEYLTAAVLDRQPEQYRRFMLSTSVLEHLTGTLCDAVTHTARGQATLEELERAGAPVVGPDPAHPWPRYHPLLRSLLRRRLRDEDPALERLLLRRAADWHLARGEAREGVRYLVEAQVWSEVVDAAYAWGPAMLNERRATEVAQWLEQIPADARHGDDRVRILLAEAAATVFGSQPFAARPLLDEVDRMQGLASGERLLADLLRAYVALAEGSDREASNAAERVLAGAGAVDDAELPNPLGLTGSSVDLMAAARVAHGVALMYNGGLSVARADFEDVADEAHGMWRATALGARGLAEAWCGNLTVGEELAHRSIALAEHLGHDPASRTTAVLALAFAARARDEFDRAAELLDEVERTGGTRRRAVAVWVATERAHIALAAERTAAGRAALAGPRASQHPSLPAGILARRLAAEALLLITAGDLDVAEELLGDGTGTEISEVVAAHVRLVLERGDVSRARALVESWPTEPLPRADRERRLWLAVLDHLDGNEAAACSQLAGVVAEAAAEGDFALFEPAGNYALGPARALYRAAPSVFLRALVDRPITFRQAKPVKGLAEQLTDREYMVLVRLPTRQSNAEIAERLGVSLNTVKTHLKHIYRKLDVAGRSEAVEAAERMHLM